MTKWLKPATALLFLSFLLPTSILLGCKDDSPRVNGFGFRQQHYLYQLPEKTDDGWEVSSLHQEGLDASLISECMRQIVVENYQNIHSTLIVKNNKLVLDEYFYGYHRDNKHPIRSATKSIGSVLTGIAIDKGLLKDAEETLYPYFKNDAADTRWGEWSKSVTVKHLLTMTSGYDCDDHRSGFACEHEMYETDDWVHYALKLPMSYPPGTHWAYNSASLILLGEIISRQSRMPISDFANRYLFGPLGIADFKWGRSPNGRAWLAGNAEMRPRDMAKFGTMVLNDGKWKDRQIVSQAWISESTGVHISQLPGRYHQKHDIKYGYLWWHRTFHRKNPATGKMETVNSIIASGNGGQLIYLFPCLDMVAVFTGGNYNSRLADQPNTMLITYILPAIL